MGAYTICYENVYFSNAFKQSINPTNEIHNRIKLLKDNIKTNHLNKEERETILDIVASNLTYFILKKIT